jgi:hypothetical protein
VVHRILLDPSGRGYCAGCKNDVAFLRVCPKDPCEELRCELCLPGHLEEIHDPGGLGQRVRRQTQETQPMHTDGSVNGSARNPWNWVLVALLALNGVAWLRTTDELEALKGTLKEARGAFEKASQEMAEWRSSADNRLRNVEQEQAVARGHEEERRKAEGRR